MHIMLWHRGFWFLAIANFLIAMSVYCLVPVLPRWLMSNEGFTSEEAGIAMGAFGVGLFVFGGFCSYLNLSSQSCLHGVHIGDGHLHLIALLSVQT